MAPRKDPASVVVDFFSTVPIETAATVLAICKGIVAKRQPAKAKRGQKAVVDVALKAVNG
jgi:hypothetical protein